MLILEDSKQCESHVHYAWENIRKTLKTCRALSEQEGIDKKIVSHDQRVARNTGNVEMTVILTHLASDTLVISHVYILVCIIIYL